MSAAADITKGARHSDVHRCDENENDVERCRWHGKPYVSELTACAARVMPMKGTVVKKKTGPDA